MKTAGENQRRYPPLSSGRVRVFSAGELIVGDTTEMFAPGASMSSATVETTVSWDEQRGCHGAMPDAESCCVSRSCSHERAEADDGSAILWTLAPEAIDKTTAVGAR